MTGGRGLHKAPCRPYFGVAGCLRLSRGEKELLESMRPGHDGVPAPGHRGQNPAFPRDQSPAHEIHHIGNNINEIARSVNAGIARAEDAKRGLYLSDQVYALMYQTVKKMLRFALQPFN